MLLLSHFAVVQITEALLRSRPVRKQVLLWLHDIMLQGLEGHERDLHYLSHWLGRESTQISRLILCRGRWKETWLSVLTSYTPQMGWIGPTARSVFLCGFGNVCCWFFKNYFLHFQTTAWNRLLLPQSTLHENSVKNTLLTIWKFFTPFREFFKLKVSLHRQWVKLRKGVGTNWTGLFLCPLTGYLNPAAHPSTNYISLSSQALQHKPQLSQ